MEQNNSIENKKKKILVVEDSDTMRHLIRFALIRLRDSEVVEAEDGSIAIKLLNKHNFDLIITDLIMPRIDGFKLIKYVRKQNLHSNVPIIVVSTQYAVEEQDRISALGANAYISKPMHSGVLIKTVEKLLYNKDLQSGDGSTGG